MYINMLNSMFFIRSYCSDRPNNAEHVYLSAIMVRRAPAIDAPLGNDTQREGATPPALTTDDIGGG